MIDHVRKLELCHKLIFSPCYTLQVVAFLLALFRKSVDRRIGNVMLAHALHGDCIEGESIVRKFTLKVRQCRTVMLGRLVVPIVVQSIV